MKISNSHHAQPIRASKPSCQPQEATRSSSSTPHQSSTQDTLVKGGRGEREVSPPCYFKNRDYKPNSDFIKPDQVSFFLTGPEGKPLCTKDGCHVDAGLIYKLLKKYSISEKSVFRVPFVKSLAVTAHKEVANAIIRELPESIMVQPNYTIDFQGHLAKKASLLKAKPSELDDLSKVVRSEKIVGLNKVHDMGFKGKGQRVIVIDSGVAMHPDFEGRLAGFKDFTFDRSKKPIDPYGHGTMMTGLVIGDGSASDGKVKGVAPEAEAYVLRISDEREAISALEWCVENKDKLGADVINMSLGAMARRGQKNDLWAKATQKAIDAGFVVAVAAGNEGPDPKTISTPGILEDAITVGAYDDNRTEGLYADDGIAHFQSRGPTIDALEKPDVVFNGVHIVSPGNRYARSLDNFDASKNYVLGQGSSQATALASGLALLLKQVNPDLTHHQIKDILQRSAQDHLGLSRNDQGAGFVDAEKAVKLAQEMLPSEEKSSDIA